MRLNIQHTTSYVYDPAVESAALRLRLYPSAYDAQKVEEWSVTVNGVVVEPLFVSGFGDEHGLFHHQGQLGQIDITAKGVVVVEDRSGVVTGLPGNPPTGVFLRHTDMTRPDDAIASMAEQAARSDALEELHQISASVQEAVTYRPGVTTPETTAIEALQLGVGVCQDQSHLFLAAARSRGHPARYVSGYLLSEEGQEEVNQTHAWVEAHVPNLGWVGFDPTNQICPTDRYVRLGCGLDANDAAPVRGAIIAHGEENLVASVSIEQAQ